jgi:two-component system nitrate/nitrite response regulator NarL
MSRILIADDHPLMLSGLEAVLRDTPYQVVGKARDGIELLNLLPTSRPDILIVDINMPGRSGIEVLRTLRSKGDRRPVILLTADLHDDALADALDLDVNGIILKEGAETLLITCLDQVARGGRWIDGGIVQRALDIARKGAVDRGPLAQLTVRERAIAQLVGQGLRNREIGEELGLTEGTVKVALHRIYEKLSIESRVDLAMLARDAERSPRGANQS